MLKTAVYDPSKYPLGTLVGDWVRTKYGWLRENTDCPSLDELGYCTDEGILEESGFVADERASRYRDCMKALGLPDTHFKPRKDTP